jgi:ATP-dependent DNA helicase RecG
VVIDEQHRFGTAQRRKLVRKDKIAPHLLSMTATPIPRTLALTIYGDLDLSLLDEMPAGRKQIITEIIIPNKRDETYEKIRVELKNGRQLYVICPRINEPDPEKEMAVQAKSAVAEAKRLKKEIFREYEIGVLHSKMSKQKKEEVMKEFVDGKINILCATSVVEVGVNVPNATIIIIEGAERFGLAQLHQLRGRVIRSNYQAYCYVFADAKSDKTIQRLKALKTAKNGFELAELDLTLRGSGELGGNKQWGITDLGMEAIKNLKMVEAARTEAIRLITEDPELSKYPLLKQKVHEKAGEFHFE